MSNAENNRIARAFQYAMQLEKDGYDFYMESSEKFSNPNTTKLFVDLANEEKGHYVFLEQTQKNFLDDPENYQVDDSVLEEGKSLFEMRAEDQKIDTTLQQSQVPDLTILRMAMLVEMDAAQFYADQAEASDDERIKAVFDMLSEWEKGHEKMFRDEYNRLLKEYMEMPLGG